ncbi:rab effector MyRIP isoform X2 [Echeneis naucrates]|uniref:rab effector MyRIP isoform X2 n=1 Tax=Echeneis naucrates TaxID=173247 RepID=UPI0011133312|nr:rab effector MyRIP-like isoform X2 [Echeneis naucrates]
MGRRLDLSRLTENEAEHVLQVVQRDMKLRKSEEERLSELKQELDEEGSRSLLLSRQSCFNQRCCIRCCLPFTFLLNPKRRCRDCRYNVCKSCCIYNKRDKAWLCSVCQKSRLLKTQSLEWFYTNVKKRFKRFGSAKVLKTLYRKHLAEHSTLSELTEGSAYEESICNEGSICGSDSTFYRQSEEHSMAETLSVALRVAEEVIDEAISKAEFDTANQERQNEALYLREHRGELVEELAKTIMQKIISRRRTLAEMGTQCDQDWTLEKNAHPHHRHFPSDQGASSLAHQRGLWRSQSASSLLENDPPGQIQNSLLAFKREGSGSTISTWKSVDRLDNAGVSSVLKSPDGNWIALQSAQLSRPSLLTKRKSLVYSALERESGVVSAYEGMGSDNETKPESDNSWGNVLQEIHKKMKNSNFSLQDTQNRTPLPLTDHQGSREDIFSDSEGNWTPNKHLLGFFKKKTPAEIRRPPSSQRTSIMDVNFNVDMPREEEENRMAAAAEVGQVRRSQKKNKSNKEQAASSSVTDFNRENNQSQPTSDAMTPDTLTSGASTPENDPIRPKANEMDERLTLKLPYLAGFNEDRDCDELNGERRPASEEGDRDGEKSWKMEADFGEIRMKEEDGDLEVDDEEMKNRLYRLVTQSRLSYFSSTEDELDKAGQDKAEWDEEIEEDKEQEAEKTERLTYKLYQLENEVRATQFSSTEDELDRVGLEERKTEEEEEDGRKEELAMKVCRLAEQANATQFSSTEDELDRAGRGQEGEEAVDDETFWKLQAEKAVQASQLRNLASLVSTSQFSSTEDELDRVEANEGEREMNGGVDNIVEMEDVWEGTVVRRGSFEDLDVKMFDLMDETEQTKNMNSDEKPIAENVLDGQPKTDYVQHCKEGVEEPQENGFLDKIGRKAIEDELIVVEKHICEDRAEKAKETQEGQGTKLNSVVKAKTAEEITEAEETREERENQPEAKWPDKNEREDENKNSKEGQRMWEATADSEEEDTEFNRIISSMLMITLEDMQAAEIRKINREELETDGCVKVGGEGGFKDAQGTTSSEETGSVKEHQDDSIKSEVDVREDGTEKTGGKKTSGELTSRKGDKQDERERRNFAFQPNEAQQACKREVDDDDEREDGGETVETQGAAEETKETDQSSSSSPQEGLLSPEEIQNRYSAVSLRSITTEVLKVLNATEELLQEVEGGDDVWLSSASLPPNTDPKKLDQQFSRLEENVYVAAGSVYSLEAELSDLEECARGICSSTSEMELSFLEEQVASAAAKVQQSELQICDISARIAALKNAGLKVDTQTQSRFSKSTVTSLWTHQGK